MGNKTLAVAAAVALISIGGNGVGNSVSAFSTFGGVVRPSNVFVVPSTRTCSATSLHMSAPPLNEVPVESQNADFPVLGNDGLYQINNAVQHKALLDANPDKLVIVKFFAPWCRACKGLAPKYLAIVHRDEYKNMPIIWAEMTIQGNKDYVKSLGVLALPSMQFYAGTEGIVENFPCGPSKVPILRAKLKKLVEDKVDPVTLTLKAPSTVEICDEETEDEACTERVVAGVSDQTRIMSVGDVVIGQEQLNYLRYDIPYFKDFTDEEFDSLMSRAKLATFEPGSVIMRQGKTGKSFYVIESGAVEISVKTAFEDPLTTPAGYLGAVINTLTTNNFFGERALITGEPRAASIRAVQKTRCFKFDVADIPQSSVLSGKKIATQERKAEIDDKYGLDVYDIDLMQGQFKTANVFNQARGSVYNNNVPDSDEEIDQAVEELLQLKKAKNDNILSLLVRLQMIRHATRCFDYILMTKPTWGDAGETKRRSILAQKLTPAKTEEFTEVFKIMDHDNNGRISVLELKRVIESTGSGQYTDAELNTMINLADPSFDGNSEINFKEFMGVMAEAEFYYLFRETFSMLDKYDSGFVKAGELDQVLSGVRDLVSDDRMSIIDVEDKDMMIDYESFTKMLLGSAI
mmetsp:Transcript_15418/g.22129  ORF Transcript_15418/g.22129 Transcript_15418/m.22129 type:complete len:632 (+) Transcript_15418:105-2000(+)